MNDEQPLQKRKGIRLESTTYMKLLALGRSIETRLEY